MAKLRRCLLQWPLLAGSGTTVFVDGGEDFRVEGAQLWTAVKKGLM